MVYNRSTIVPLSSLSTSSVKRFQRAQMERALKLGIRASQLPWCQTSDIRCLCAPIVISWTVFQGSPADDIIRYVLGTKKNTDKISSIELHDKTFTNGSSSWKAIKIETRIIIAVSREDDQLSHNYLLDGRYSVRAMWPQQKSMALSECIAASELGIAG